MTCETCRGTGWEIRATKDKDNKDVEVAKACACRRPESESEESLARALRIPPRYAHCTLAKFDAGHDPGLESALKKVVSYCIRYPSLVTDKSNEGLGLLFTGTNGTGKTHLAVGTLRELAAVCGVRGQFWDFHELLREIKNSYNQQTAITEYDVLEPVIETPVLLLDDLGAWRMTNWMNDTLFYILNMRYVARRASIITTNYPESGRAERDVGRQEQALDDPHPAPPASERLVDRIGQRLRSRLLEACAIIRVDGDDRRQKRQRDNQDLLS